MVELFAEEAACKIFCILKAGKMEAEILKLVIEFQIKYAIVSALTTFGIVL